MRGWYLVNSSFNEGRDTLHQARALFERALQIDPNEIDALDGTAVTYFFDFINGWGDPGTDYEAKVLGQANRAIALDPDNRRAYWAKADYLVLSRRPGEALGAADAGLAINPNIPALYQARALAENSLGRYEQGKADAERAIHLSPRDPAMGFWHIALGDAELGLNHFDVAIGEFQKAIDAGAHYYIPYVNLAAAYALAGKMDEAKNALAEGRRLNPNLTVKWLADHAPNIPPLFDGLRKAGLPEE
jgi:tetratricopeptide (TPR) repeat protein